MRKLCEVHAGAKRTADGRCSKCESMRRMDYRARNLARALEVRAAYRERERELEKARHAANPEPGRARVKKWRDKNPGKEREKNKAWRIANKDRIKARMDAWRAANPDKVRANAAAWRRANPDKVKARNQKSYAKADKAKLRAVGKAWQNANRDKVRASVMKWSRANPGCNARYEAAKLNATPAWANDFFISEAYALARLRTKLQTGGVANWHVDHIVPLISKHVCGLHVEHNLEVIPGAANSAKGNRRWPDMPALAA